jgi:predicted MFS family arabinose efflux permease
MVIFRSKKHLPVIDDDYSSATDLLDFEFPVAESTPRLILTLLKNFRITFLLIFTLFLYMCGTSVYLILVIRLSTVYSQSTSQLGLSFLAIAPIQILACLVGGYLYDKYGFKTTATTSLLLLTLSTLGLIFPLALAPFLILMSTFTAISIISCNPILPELSCLVKEDDQSLIFSMFSVCVSVGSMVGPLLGTFLFDLVGFERYIILIGTVTAGLMISTTVYSSRGDEITGCNIIII